jgi:phospholipid-binding lipoprotein MlaA
LDTVDSRSRELDTLDELQKTAIDFYAEIRSLSRQHRAIELRHGEPGDLPKLDSSKGAAPAAPQQAAASE